jgi:diguanylate cyclase (GGDEF)-like protein/hemerythrin-like metal-binding protein/PAS domain S-box-containing protein
MNDSLEIFPWNENLATGVPKIDEQHKKLVQLLNKLAAGLAYRVDMPDLNNIFNELADYAAYHFQTEESVWHQFMAGDEWEAEHRRSHEQFVAEVLRLRGEENSKPLHEVLEDVLGFLTHWLAFHILSADKRLAKVALAVQSGKSVEEAKRQAKEEMGGAAEVLVETVLSMYDALSSRTLQLMKEVVERQKAEQKANALILRNRVMMQSTPEGVHILDEEGNIIEANEAFCRHLGCSMEEVLRLSLFDFEAKTAPDELRVRIKELLDGHARFESVHRRRDGTLVDVEVTVSGLEIDGVKYLFSLSRDITGRKQAEATIRSLAFYDTLTQLPNRRLLNDRLEQAMAASRRSGCCGALMFLDLDNFKPLNDKYGHSVGDLLLVKAARRIAECIRETDTVARFGGDEFVVMLGELDEDRSASALQARLVAEKISAALSRTYVLPFVPTAQSENGAQKAMIEHRCTASIGVALFINHEAGVDDVIRFADMAMYRAKEAGAGMIRFFEAAA